MPGRAGAQPGGRSYLSTSNCSSSSRAIPGVRNVSLFGESVDWPGGRAGRWSGVAGKEPEVQLPDDDRATDFFTNDADSAVVRAGTFRIATGAGAPMVAVVNEGVSRSGDSAGGNPLGQPHPVFPGVCDQCDVQVVGSGGGTHCNGNLKGEVTPDGIPAVCAGSLGGRRGEMFFRIADSGKSGGERYGRWGEIVPARGWRDCRWAK